MDWQCWLYGHHWRHPHQHQVILKPTDGPVHSFECQRCDTRAQLVKETGTIHGDWKPR